MPAQNEERKRQRQEERARERRWGWIGEREPLPPYFVNKSDLQDKRSATFRVNSAARRGGKKKTQQQRCAIKKKKKPRGHQLGPINM